MFSECFASWIKIHLTKGLYDIYTSAEALMRHSKRTPLHFSSTICSNEGEIQGYSETFGGRRQSDPLPKCLHMYPVQMVRPNPLAPGPSEKRYQIRNLKDPIFGTRRNKE